MYNSSGVPDTARGFCWDTISNPTILKNYSRDSNTNNTFSRNITGLVAGKLYYIRAYATTIFGTSYSTQDSFKTLPLNSSVTKPSSGTLYIVGSATQAGWNINFPDSTQKFYRKDSVTYEGVFNLNGGQEYLLMPVYGSWNDKYAVADASVSGIANGTGGAFGFYSPSNPSIYNRNIPAPPTSGWYKIVVDFAQGIYTVTPYIIGDSTIPSTLILVGDYNNWVNIAFPAANSVFTQLNSCQYQITANLPASSSYLLLPTPGSWNQRFSVENSLVPSSGGSFGYWSIFNNTKYSANFIAPAVAGTHIITVNFFDNTFIVK